MRMAFGIPKAIRMADTIIPLPRSPNFRSVVTVVEKSKFLSVTRPRPGNFTQRFEVHLRVDRRGSLRAMP